VVTKKKKEISLWGVSTSKCGLPWPMAKPTNPRGSHLGGQREKTTDWSQKGSRDEVKKNEEETLGEKK